MATSIVESNVTNLESIEALAILRGLQLCMHQWISNLIIKSDFLFLVEEISSQEDPNLALGNIFLDIKDFLWHFINYRIQYGGP